MPEIERVPEEGCKRLENALREIGRGPNNSAIGHVVEDCALVHMDYLGSVDMAASLVGEVVAEITGESPAEVSARLRPTRRCDCPARGCAGPEKSAEVREEYRAHLLANLTPEFRSALLDEFRERLLSDEAVDAANQAYRDRKNAGGRLEAAFEAALDHVSIHDHVQGGGEGDG